MNNVTTVGIDLAKNVFSVHGVNAQGCEVLRRTVRREQLLALIARLPNCLIGMEACSGAHASSAGVDLKLPSSSMSARGAHAR